MKLLSMHPLSSSVLLVETEQGWRLSDGRRYTKPYAGFEAAIDDKVATRCLTFGEPLENEEVPGG